MPVARRDKPDERKRITALLRLLLIEARGDHVIYGRLLQGPTAVERLYDEDLGGLVRIYERWRSGQ